MTTGDAVWKFRREIPSDSSIGSSLVNELLDVMLQREWPEIDLFRTLVAFEEAIVNAIRHGNQCETDKTVVVEMSCDFERVMIQITDQGEGFDPKLVPDPRQAALLREPGGRGVLLINRMMSQVEYNERGNQVKMVKVKGDSPQSLDDDLM